MAEATFPVSDLTKRITFNVKVVGYKRWLVRLRIAKSFFWLGAKIAGVGIKFEQVEDK